MERCYLYGVTEATSESALDFMGLDGSSPVRIVAWNGMGCIVSQHLDDSPRAVSSREKLLVALLAHQRVIERVMQQHDVLPMKFGTLLDGEMEVRALLAQSSSQLRAPLAAVRGKVELEVVATWDTSSALRRLGATESVAQARSALVSRGQTTQAERVQFGKLVKGHLDDLRRSYAQRAADCLKPLAADMVSHTLLREEMVFSLAFLVERARLAQFEERVQDADRLFESELALKMIGPLPPYSFGTVEVTRLGAEELGEARRTLHVAEGASEAEVRRAYRRQAAWAHRAAEAGAPGDQDLLHLRRASDLLLAQDRARDAAQQVGGNQLTVNGQGIPLFLVAVGSPEGKEAAPAYPGGPGQVAKV